MWAKSIIQTRITSSIPNSGNDYSNNNADNNKGKFSGGYNPGGSYQPPGSYQPSGLYQPLEPYQPPSRYQPPGPYQPPTYFSPNQYPSQQGGQFLERLYPRFPVKYVGQQLPPYVPDQSLYVVGGLALTESPQSPINYFKELPPFSANKDKKVFVTV